MARRGLDCGYYLMNIESPLPASALDLFTWSRPSRSSWFAMS